MNKNINKFKEYEMKIIKMAGHVSDHYIDNAIDTDDYSEISSFLIDYFAGPVGKSFDVGYLISKYKEFGLDEKVEDIDFDIDVWYKVIYEAEHNVRVASDETKAMIKMSDEEYVQYMINKRKKDTD